MTEHSKLPPSSAARRMSCPGSRALSELYPQEESEASREGTAAHWVAAQKLKNIKYDLPQYAPNSELITDEMIDGAELYAEEINRITPIDDKLHVEERINIFNIHPEMWGTPDCWFYDVYTEKLHIWDYKFGFGYIEVLENWQLIAYAAGILDTLNIKNNVGVVFTIVQPRCFGNSSIRKWKTSSYELMPYFDRLKQSSFDSMKSNAECKTSSECVYCPASHACQALQQTSGKILDSAGINTPFNLTGIQTSFELKHLRYAVKLLEARVNGLESQALAMIKRGERVPGFTLASSQGRELWKLKYDEIISLGELFGVDLKKPADVITPRQAVKAGLPEELLNGNTERKSGTLKLIEDNAKKVFRNV